MPPAPLSRRQVLLAGAALTATAVLGTSCADDGAGALRLRVVEVDYGPEPQQSGDLHTPLSGGPHPVVVLVHGGYWSTGFDRSAMRPLAEELVQLGYAAWNIDYRRVGDPGGGWPGTLEDVATAMDLLADRADADDLDLDRVAVIGHSAGSQLAMWSTARGQLPPGAPGAGPVVVPTAAASLSGVLDLAGAVELPAIGRFEDLRRSVIDLLGGTPQQVPDRYALASPIELLPLGVPQLLLHGIDDDIVPASLTFTYRDAAAAAGDEVTTSIIEGVDHFDTAVAEKAWWSAVLNWLPTVLGPSPR